MRRKRFTGVFLAVLLLIGLSAGPVFAGQLVETASATYFQRAYGSGSSWEDREEKEYRAGSASGPVVYCLESGKSFSTGDYGEQFGYTSSVAFLNSSYVQTNLNIPVDSFLKGLLYIMSYGYPNYVPPGLTAEQARYATSAAVHTFTAQSVRYAVNEAGQGKFGYSVYAHLNPGNTSTDRWLRAKPGVSGAPATFEWYQSLYKGAVSGLEMPHSASLGSAEVPMPESGGYFTGSVSVSLENMNYGYTIDASSLAAISAAGGSISGYSGNSGDVLTVSVPRKGNTNRSFTLSITAKDSRSIENIGFWTPANTTMNQTLAGLYAAGEPNAAGNLQKSVSAVFRTGSYGLPVSVRKLSSVTDAGGQPIYSLQGAVFRVSGTGVSGGAVSEDITTGPDGTAATTALFAVGSTVTVTELSAPAGYVLNSAPVSLSVSEEASLNVASVTNKAKLFGVSGRKTDALLPGGAADLSGAVIEVINRSASAVFVNGASCAPGSVAAQMVTAADGSYSLGAVLPMGSYELREACAPSGYELNSSWSYSFYPSSADEDGRIFAVPAAQDLKDMPIRGGISVQKADPVSGTPQGNCSFEGIRFDVVLSDREGNVPSVVVGGTEYAKGQTVMSIITDASGFATTGYGVLPRAMYDLVEAEVPASCGLVGGWKEEGRLVNGSTESFTAANSPRLFGVKGSKQDALRGSSPSGDASFVGAEISVINRSAAAVYVNGSKYEPGEVCAVMTTLSDGSYSLGPCLPYGSYELCETKAPKGYFLNSGWSWPISCSPSDAHLTVYEPSAAAELKDSPLTQGIRIRKWDKARGVGTAGQVYPKEALEGIGFEVVNKSVSAIVYGGRTVAPGEVIATLYTSFDGASGEYAAQIDGLPYGSYSVRELYQGSPEDLKANDWYVVDDEAAVKTQLHFPEEQANRTKALDFTDTRVCTLKVVKTVEGNMASRDKQFAFELRLGDNSGIPVRYKRTAADGSTGSGTADFSGGAFGFSLAHGESMEFSYIVSGNSYELSEPGAEEDGYDVSFTGAPSGTVDSDLTVKVKNHRASVVGTGLHGMAGHIELAASSGALGTMLLAFTGKKERHERKKSKKKA